MALAFKFGTVFLCFLSVLMTARAQFGRFGISPQSIFDLAAAQTQAIFKQTNDAIARGMASGNGISVSSGVVRRPDGTGSSWVGGSGTGGVYHFITNKKK